MNEATYRPTSSEFAAFLEEVERISLSSELGKTAGLNPMPLLRSAWSAGKAFLGAEGGMAARSAAGGAAFRKGMGRIPGIPAQGGAGIPWTGPAAGASAGSAAPASAGAFQPKTAPNALMGPQASGPSQGTGFMGRHFGVNPNQGVSQFSSGDWWKNLSDVQRMKVLGTGATAGAGALGMGAGMAMPQRQVSVVNNR